MEPRPGERGFVAAQRLAEVATDLRQRSKPAHRVHVESRIGAGRASLERLVEQALRVVETSLAPAHHGERVECAAECGAVVALLRFGQGTLGGRGGGRDLELVELAAFVGQRPRRRRVRCRIDEPEVRCASRGAVGGQGHGRGTPGRKLERRRRSPGGVTARRPVALRQGRITTGPRFLDASRDAAGGNCLWSTRRPYSRRGRADRR